MSEFFFRTEDIKPDKVTEFFAETKEDRRVLERLGGSTPVVLVGSRGVGKSLLFRVAQARLMSALEQRGVLPVYVSFTRSSLIDSHDEVLFQAWMLGRICAAVVRSLRKLGRLDLSSGGARILSGGGGNPVEDTAIELLIPAFESAWKGGKATVPSSTVPSVDDFKCAVEDLCQEQGFERIVLFIDEAAHVLRARQQRLFFDLYRDLRSHCLTSHAAVYPGVTSYGDSFQPTHDATMVTLDRDILDPEYVTHMREIVEKQADSETLKNVSRNSKNFAVLAYASCGNPRVLLKTLARSASLKGSDVNGVIRSYYRSEIWADHSLLAERYAGHKSLLDWGRNFIEDTVLPEIKAKNESYLAEDKSSSAFFWVHRDAPQGVVNALDLLAYTGIVAIHEKGIKATRSEIGTRYIVNLGCLLSLENHPTSTGFVIASNLTPKRMTEFGRAHNLFSALPSVNDSDAEASSLDSIRERLQRPIQILDLTDFQKEKLLELSLLTIGDVLDATEAKLKEARYVGDVRARQMQNAADAAVFEYLSG